MTTAHYDSAIIGKLFSRTPPGQELRLPQWERLISDITNIAASANALMCVFAQEGSGKTTFVRMLRESVKSSIDTLHLSPASPSTRPGWLLEAISPWLTSESKDTGTMQARIASLAESHRPILICLDAGDLIHEDHLSNDLEALLNLADSCDLKLSVLICCGEKRSMQIAENPTTANRLLLFAQLPQFTEEQLINFLSTKCQGINIATIKDAEISFAAIAKKAEGRPTQGLRLLAETLGQSIQTSNITAAETPAKASNGQLKTARQGTNKSRLADLLAPPRKQ